MNIYTVRDNLKNTIAGKELFLESLDTNTTVGSVTKTYTEININELKRILTDVEKCCEKATEDSWAKNPDRMGGQFTAQDVDRASDWDGRWR